MKKILYSSIIAIGAILCGCSDEAKDPAVTPTVPEITELPAASTTLIYEANPRFFGTKDCLQAINNRLDEIKDMGTTVLWLMPVCDPGKVKSIGSPYCIRDYKALNSKYGTVEDLKELVVNAHSKGMKVILDWVANHTAWDCVWIATHPEWYTQDANGNIISPKGTGWNDVADLNFDNTEMRAAMIDAMIYWVNTAGVDGYRCDYADGVPTDFWNEAITAIREVKPEAIMLAEGKGNNLYAAGFDMTYDWNYNTELQKYFNNQSSFSNLVKTSRSQLTSLPEGKSILRYAINHDVISEKSPTALFGSDKAMEAAYVLATFMGGTPLIYSGQEAGFTAATSFMNYRKLAWKEELVNKYAAIGKAYRATAKARGGQMSYIDNGQTATIYYINGNTSALVFVNPSAMTLTVNTPAAFTNKDLENAITGEKVTLGVTTTIAPYEYLIYKR